MQVDAAPGLVPNGPGKAIKSRASPSSPTKKASRLEPQTPAKLATRAVPRSPSKGPHSPASREAAAVFSRASPYSPGARPAVPLPPPRMWRRSRMAGGVNPGVAHAVGRQPRHLAQVVLYSCCLVICRVKMLAQQCYFRVLEVPTVLGKATHNWTCIWA